MITLLHDAEGVVAVDKVPGMPVIPARGEPPEGSLHRMLEAELGERLFIVHRIDRDTSGIVVFARNADVHRELSLAFEQRDVEKTYLAVAAGELRDSGRIDVPLHPARRGKSRPAATGEKGQPAATEYRVRERFRKEGLAMCLVELRPLTGRHHQIRVHLRSVAAPVLFDPLYGSKAVAGKLADAPMRRLALHAWRLSLPRPGATLAFEAPVPADLQDLLAWLGDGGAQRTDGAGATAGRGRQVSEAGS